MVEQTYPTGWPLRYEVTVMHQHEEPGVYTALTWEGPEKAKSLALVADNQWFTDNERTGEIKIVELGRASLKENGNIIIGNDLHDRREF